MYASCVVFHLMIGELRIPSPLHKVLNQMHHLALSYYSKIGYQLSWRYIVAITTLFHKSTGWVYDIPSKTNLSDMQLIQMPAQLKQFHLTLTCQTRYEEILFKVNLISFVFTNMLHCKIVLHYRISYTICYVSKFGIR